MTSHSMRELRLFRLTFRKWEKLVGLSEPAPDVVVNVAAESADEALENGRPGGDLALWSIEECGPVRVPAPAGPVADHVAPGEHVTVNLNDKVTVELTDRGQVVWYKHSGESQINILSLGLWEFAIVFAPSFRVAMSEKNQVFKRNEVVITKA